MITSMFMSVPTPAPSPGPVRPLLRETVPYATRPARKGAEAPG
ncbi:hypothetical protein [Streptomyces yangpuensis]